MCGTKSKHGLKSIGLSLLLLLLVVSPCCAAASWAAWFKAEDTKATDSQSQLSPADMVNQTVEAGQESSLTLSTTPSENPETASYQEFLRQLDNLEKQQTALETELQTVGELSQSLDVQLESLKTTNAISDAEYQAVKESLMEVLPANTLQADRIAELEKEAGSKAYMLVGGFVGFEDSLPTYGLSLDLGIRIGSSLMMQTGIDYSLGSFSDFGKFTQFSLDNLRFRAQIGWMW